MRPLFTIAARAQTTACQLFRASHSGLQTRTPRICRFVVVWTEGIGYSRYDQRDIRSPGLLARDQNIFHGRRSQPSHYRQRLSQHSSRSKQPSKRPLSQSMPLRRRMRAPVTNKESPSTMSGKEKSFSPVSDAPCRFS